MMVQEETFGDYMSQHLGIGNDYLYREETDDIVAVVVVAWALNYYYGCRIDVIKVQVEERRHNGDNGIDPADKDDGDMAVSDSLLAALRLFR